MSDQTPKVGPPTLEEAIAALRLVVDAFDRAGEEKYDECKWDAFREAGDVAPLRALLARVSP